MPVKCSCYQNLCEDNYLHVDARKIIGQVGYTYLGWVLLEFNNPSTRKESAISSFSKRIRCEIQAYSSSACVFMFFPNFSYSTLRHEVAQNIQNSLPCYLYIGSSGKRRSRAYGTYLLTRIKSTSTSENGLRDESDVSSPNEIFTFWNWY